MRKHALLGLALCVGACSPGVAHQATTTQDVPDRHCSYVVRQGDSLYRIADRDLPDPNQWQWIYDQNPRLQLPGIRTVGAKGWIYVMIHPGETLCGVDQAGHLTMPTPVATAAPTNLEPSGYIQPVAGNKSFFTKVGEWLGSIFLPLLWLALIALALFTLWVFGRWLLRRELDKDPARSGPAFVPGGVDGQAAREHFAAAAHHRRFTILETVAGYGYGIVRVTYADGTSKLRNLKAEAMFRARVRNVYGDVQELYMLQRCGNDLYLDGRSRYVPGPEFRFVAGETIDPPAPVATPEPASAEADELVLEPASAVAPAAEPAPSEATVDDGKALQPGEIVVEYRRDSGKVDSDGKPDSNLVRVSGVELDHLAAMIKPTGVTIRFRVLNTAVEAQ
jgi:hypothetical protein